MKLEKKYKEGIIKRGYKAKPSQHNLQRKKKRYKKKSSKQYQMQELEKKASTEFNVWRTIIICKNAEKQVLPKRNMLKLILVK